MPNTRSAAKQMRQNIRRRERNRAVKSATRTQVKRADMLIAGGRLEEAPEAVRLAQRALDKAAEKGVLHKNNAARHKARLMIRLREATAVGAGQAPEAKAPAKKGRTAAAKTKGATTTRARAKAPAAAGAKATTAAKSAGGTTSRRKTKS